MQPVSGRTRMMAIQAVASEMRQLRAEIAKGDSPELPDLQEMLMAYDDAADRLRDAYIAECRDAINLPVYESLVGEE